MSLIGREVYESIPLMRVLALSESVVEEPALRVADGGGRSFPAPAPVIAGERELAVDELALRRRAR